MTITFQHPLTERVRSFLRIEHLFTRLMQTIKSEDIWQHHLAIITLFEILECSSRVELKYELLQELEKQRQWVQKSDDSANFITKINEATQDLQSVSQRFGKNIRENEWLMVLKQRVNIAGGTTAAELPSYYFWQQQSAKKRQADLQKWSQVMMPTFQAAHLLLEILRERAIVYDCQAEKGNYQHSKLPSNVQMLVIEVDEKAAVLPEIAANKYFTHISFLHANQEQIRGAETKQDIVFKMKMCSFDAA
jgi:cell division protein ZapD